MQISSPPHQQLLIVYKYSSTVGALWIPPVQVIYMLVLTFRSWSRGHVVEISGCNFLVIYKRFNFTVNVLILWLLSFHRHSMMLTEPQMYILCCEYNTEDWVHHGQVSLQFFSSGFLQCYLYDVTRSLLMWEIKATLIVHIRIGI